jgi:hypothetical protein
MVGAGSLVASRTPHPTDYQVFIMNKDQLKGRTEETKGKGKDDKESKGAIPVSAGKHQAAPDDRKEERRDARKGK